MQAGVSARGPYLETESRLTDVEIRRALLAGTWPLGFVEGSDVIEEVRIWGGHVRADLVLSSRDSLCVVEIKSDRDTLRRFAEQVRVYSSFADRVVLVVGWSHAAEALRATPCWWDVWLAERPPNEGTVFVPLRDGANNPSAQPMSLARMLPVEAMRHLAMAAGRRGGASTRSHDLRRFLADRLTLSELRVAVADRLSQLSRRRKRKPAFE